MEKLKNFSSLFKMARTVNKVASSLNRQLKRYDIAAEQRVILEIIQKEKDITQNQISNLLAKDKTTVSRTLDAIEKKQYIKRVSSSEDKRAKMIKLTQKGDDILKETKEVIEKFRQDSLRGLNMQDVENISTYLQIISLNIDEIENAK